MFDNAKSIRRSLINHPEQWATDRHVLTHTPSGFALWVCNGFWFLSQRRGGAAKDGRFGFIEKLIIAAPALHLYRKLKRELDRHQPDEFRGGE
jgi:hypothetical protein